MELELSAPFIAKQGYLEDVCFYEGQDYLLQLHPAEQFKPSQHARQYFEVGKNIELPDGMRVIESVEPINHLDIDYLNGNLQEHLHKFNAIFTNRIVKGYRYKLGVR